MKSVCLLSLLVLSVSASAGTCKISSFIFDNWECSHIGVGFNTKSAESCKEYAVSAKDTRFFDLLEKDVLFLNTRYTYKDATTKTKEIFRYERSFEYCIR